MSTRYRSSRAHAGQGRPGPDARRDGKGRTFMNQGRGPHPNQRANGKTSVWLNNNVVGTGNSDVHSLFRSVWECTVSSECRSARVDGVLQL